MTYIPQRNSQSALRGWRAGLFLHWAHPLATSAILPQLNFGPCVSRPCTVRPSAPGSLHDMHRLRWGCTILGKETSRYFPASPLPIGWQLVMARGPRMTLGSGRTPEPSLLEGFFPCWSPCQGWHYRLGEVGLEPKSEGALFVLTRTSLAGRALSRKSFRHGPKNSVMLCVLVGTMRGLLRL